MRTSRPRWWLPGIAALVAFILWGWAAAAGHVPDECSGYRSPGQEACRYLFVLRYGLEWPFAWIEGHDKFFVALGTIAIAIFTGTLWWTTNRLWQASKQQSADMQASIAAQAASATAAQETADALVEANRPHMVTSDLYVDGLKGPVTEAGQVEIRYRSRLTNYGRSPAILRREAVVIATEPELAPVPDYMNPVALRFIVPVNVWYGTGKDIPLMIPAKDRDEIIAGKRNVYVFGFVEYQDVRGRPHRHAYCYLMLFGEGSKSEQYFPTGSDAYWETT